MMSRATILLWHCFTAGNGVTANMPGLGPGDSGFESRFPDLFLLCMV